MNERKLQQLAETAAKLEELTEHPSWAVLKKTFEAKRERYFASLARSLMAGDDVDRPKLDYMRGYWAGVGHVLANPERAVKTVGEAMRRATALEED